MFIPSNPYGTNTSQRNEGNGSRTLHIGKNFSVHLNWEVFRCVLQKRLGVYEVNIFLP